jgi:hypothetical protein
VGNYVLTLHHTRCPDGAEFAPHPWIAGTMVRFPTDLEKGPAAFPEGWPVIRFRSERREDYRRRLETPDKLIVTEFINTMPSSDSEPEDAESACDYASLLKFVSEYGFPLEFVSMDQVMQELKTHPDPETVLNDRTRGFSTPDESGKRLAFVQTPPLEPRGEQNLFLFIDVRESLHHIWQSYETGDVNGAVKLFRDRADGIVSNLYPDIEFRDGKPALTLPISTLYGFMLMETALVITGGSQVMRCAECGTVFITGSGTGRRGTSLYCSNRCRVAAQRSRKTTPASSAQDVMTDEEKLEKIAAGVRGTVRE